jgi:hypothetical protein
VSQSRAHSLFESVANTAIGFALSMLAVAYVFPLFGIAMSLGENFTATSIMTVVSIARTYAIRRAFNARANFHITERTRK